MKFYRVSSVVKACDAALDQALVTPTCIRLRVRNGRVCRFRVSKHRVPSARRWRWLCRYRAGCAIAGRFNPTET